MAEKWHDIDHPGVWQKPKTDRPESGSSKPADDADDAAQEDKKPLVKLSEGKFAPPAEGVDFNKKCPVQVNVEYLDDSAKSMQKVTFSLYANYNDTSNNLSHYVDGFEKDGVAQAEMTMYPPPDYKEGDSVDYFFKAEHIRGEKVIDSEDLTLPQETQEIILQKGDYDENGAKANGKEQSGDNFKPNNVVKKLQGDLITTNFLPQGSDDGFFGDQTDKAVKDFQDYAIKLVRMKRSEGKTETTDTGLDQEQPDGIVGPKTRDELDKWLNNDWIKPVPTLRHGEYDDTGVDNDKGQRGTDEHHQGTPVVEAQQKLQKVGVYTDGALDGWFYDKMLCSVKDFQSAAADATFVVNGQTTQFEEKMTGYQKGEMCAATQEYLKMVVDKGGKVQSPEKPKWIKFAEDEIGQKEIKGDKDNPRIVEYFTATTLKAKHDEVAWCSAFVNWVMQKAGYDGTKSAAAKSWKNWGVDVKKPIYGTIAVFDFGEAGGHVGFIVGKQGERLLILGGNQNDQVKKSLFKKAKIVAYVFPKDFKYSEQEVGEQSGQFTEEDFSSTR
jgi:TIGR02594 family protein